MHIAQLIYCFFLIFLMPFNRIPQNLSPSPSLSFHRNEVKQKNTCSLKDVNCFQLKKEKKNV